METIRKFREDNEWTLREVSKKCGVDFGNLSSWENHTKFITEPGANKLSDLYEIPAIFLINLQSLRGSLKKYKELKDDKNTPSNVLIKKTWTIENRLNNIRPDKSSLKKPHPELSPEIEYWRQKILWIIQDAKEAIRGGSWLLALNEESLDLGFDLYTELTQLETDENGTELYFYLDRAFTELIDGSVDFRYVHRQRPIIAERHSFGLSIVHLEYGISQIIQLIRSNEWKSLKGNQLIQKSHENARKLAEFLKARNNPNTNKDNQGAETA